MNQTNRFLNRLILLLVGLLLLGVGAGVVMLYVWPAAADWWASASATALTWLHNAHDRTWIGSSTVSWLVVGFLAAILLLVILLIIALARLGGGHSTALIRTSGQYSSSGRIIIDAAFASEALGRSLDQRPEILTSRVSVVRIRKTSMMHLSVTPRQNTSPRALIDDVAQLLNNMEVLTDVATPTYLSIHTGIRSRLAHDQRRVA